MAGKSPERPEEQVARHIVSTVLGVPVTRFEDGKANRQVDALIRYRDRDAAVKDAPLEVVADHNSAFMAQWEALGRRGRKLDVPGLRDGWLVQLRHRAKVSRVKSVLPALLLAWQDSPPGGEPWEANEDLYRLGVLHAEPNANMPLGRVYLSSEGFWGFAGDERAVAEWVERMLSEQPDVPAKLAAHPGAGERHAFIWAPPSSDFGVQARLEIGGDDPFPVTPPQLPSGVTHVWIGGQTPRQAYWHGFLIAAGGGHHGGGHRRVRQPQRT